MSSDPFQQHAQLSAVKRQLLEKRLRGQNAKPSEFQTIPRHPQAGSGPVSFAQQRLWFLAQFEEANTAYNIPFGFRLRGPLNIAVLERSLNEIVRRHDALRTAFTTVAGKPETVILPKLTTPLAVKKLRNLSAQSREAEVQRLAMEDSQRPFQLSQCPLFRTVLLQLDEQEYVFLLTIHHIIFDGWSINVLMRELTALYNAFSRGKPSPLPELPVQYADFAHWHQEWLKGAALDQQLAYWKKQLAGIPPILELPIDHPRPAKQTFRGRIHAFRIPPAISSLLKTFSQKEQSTLFMLLLAVFSTLLSRYAGQEDIVIGAPVANRQRVELEGLIGFFVNILVLRTNVSGDPTFLEALQRVRKVVLDAQAHQDTPFDLLVEELHPNRDIGHHPLYQVAFALRNATDQTLTLPNVTVEPLLLHNGTAKLDLFLEMVETDQTLTGIFEYNTDLFDDETIIRMAGHFQTLLAGIIAHPEHRISELPMLTAVERQQLLVEWNMTYMDYPKEACVSQLFETQVEHTPNAVAIVSDNTQLTYRELNCRANQLAHYLQKLRVGPEILVGICLERSLDMIAAILGVLKSGGAYVPLDSTSPKERLAFMVSDAQFPVLLTQQKFISKLSHTNETQMICLDTDWETISQESEVNPQKNGVTLENIAYVIYTSGSTGKPKGVLISHRSLLNLIFWHQRTFEVTSADRATQLAGTAFDASVWEIWPYLTTGATLHLVKPEFLRAPEMLRDWLISENITISFLPTPLAEQAFVMEWPAHVALRIMLTGGDRLQQYPPVSIPFAVINNYGPTENTVVTTSGRVRRNARDDKAPSIGRPIDNTQLYILDRNLQLVPVGVPGEMYIGGAGLARGYLNRPELTQEKFMPNPFCAGPNARLYKTGDLARYLPDGNIEFLGRLDHQVKIRGFRVELGEIESQLRRHPAIRETVVVTRETTPGDLQLAAYLVAQAEPQVTVSDLCDFLKDFLPDYMIPATFTLLKAFPLTPNGKIDRRALPAPDTERPDLAETYLAPRTPAEQTMAEIWAAILPVKQIGIHDNFFELGGHSLMAVQLMTEIEKLLQVKLPLWKLFEAPTIAGLVRVLQAEQWAGPDKPALETERIDVAAETLLDETIRPAQEPTVPPAPASIGAGAGGTVGMGIFLTGATGFLGAFLLHELLQQTRSDIYCLVRAADTAEARQRLQANLERYLVWQPALADRIVPVPGDLAKPQLGLAADDFDRLAQRLAVIYHSGAQVNLLYPYSALKSVNVLGTHEVLRLASRPPVKPVHYVSTVAVLLAEDRGADDPLREDAPLPPFDRLTFGYSQSKWTAEQLIATAHARGIPCSIYRPARIAGHSQTGVWNTSDFACRMIKGCIQMGMAPEQPFSQEHWVPVDYVSQAIVHLSRQPASRGQVFHLINHRPVDWAALVDWIGAFGYPLRKLAYTRWRKEFCTDAAENVLSPLMPLFQTAEPPPHPPRFVDWNTVAGLDGTTIACPPVDPVLLHTYFAYFLRSRFLPPPQQRPSSAQL